MSDLEVQFHLRLPKEVHGKIKQRAKINGRSINTEIVMTLEESLSQPAKISGYRDEADKLAHEQAEEFTTVVVKTLTRLYADKK